MLAPIKGKYDDADYQQIRNGVLGDLTQKIKADQDWWGNHLQEYADLKAEFVHCWKSGQDPAALQSKVNFYINDLLVRARRLLPSIAAPRIQKATNLKVAQAQPKKPTARPTTQTASAATPEKQGNAHYNLKEDQEFTRMFKV
jgi:hypothetical protein